MCPAPLWDPGVPAVAAPPPPASSCSPPLARSPHNPGPADPAKTQKSVTVGQNFASAITTCAGRAPRKIFRSWPRRTQKRVAVGQKFASSGPGGGGAMCGKLEKCVPKCGGSFLPGGPDGGAAIESRKQDPGQERIPLREMGPGAVFGLNPREPSGRLLEAVRA